MKKINASLIITTLNEERNIVSFIKSVIDQTLLPKELIIVDGGSTDHTTEKIKKIIPQYENKLSIKFFLQKGNRSVGRNEAIRKSSSDIVLSSDSGNVLDKNWVKNITKPFKDKRVDVVAGYYQGKAENIFQKCLIPYVLVMPEKVDEENFLPATRSMAFKKRTWKNIGGFNEKLSHNEDYEFSNRLKESGAKITFAKDAIVNWIPRTNLKQAFKMFFRFALGDIQANIYRDKVVLIFLRYLFALYLPILIFLEKSYLLLVITISFFIFYLIWAVLKNYKYVRNKKAILYLPIIQLTSDFAVVIGSSIGIISKLSPKNCYELIIRNKSISLLLILYIVTLLSVISWGIPNINHPFDYFMDEWHQSQAVRAVFKYGTPNVFGAANGSMFHFFITGIYLIPFYLLYIIDPFAIKSSVTNLSSQYVLFVVLRFNTLFFGVLSAILISYLGKKYFRVSGFAVVFLFLINPLFIMLSNYYKYDIALVFWILMALWATLSFINKPTQAKNIITAVFLAITLSVKLSTPSLFVAYLLILFAVGKDLKEKVKYIGASITVYLFVFSFLGIPDAIFGKSNPLFYISENLTTIPQNTVNMYNLGGVNWWQYLLFYQYPLSFGKFFFYLFIISLIIFVVRILKNLSGIKSFILTYRYVFVVLLYFLFLAISLIPLNITAAFNRILVLLPFMSIFAICVFEMIYKGRGRHLKRILVLVLIIGFVVQFLETYSWVSIKQQKDARVRSSEWIVKNIRKNSEIGIENIPIYQNLPDVIIKDFYLKQYNPKYSSFYDYKIISSKTKDFPNYVILSNDFEGDYLIHSDKKKILKKLNNYKIQARFIVDLKYLKIFNKDDRDYYMSGLSNSLISITIYQKL